MTYEEMVDGNYSDYAVMDNRSLHYAICDRETGGYATGHVDGKGGILLYPSEQGAEQSAIDMGMMRYDIIDMHEDEDWGN